jgi:hypothetical protein
MINIKNLVIKIKELLGVDVAFTRIFVKSGCASSLNP